MLDCVAGQEGDGKRLPGMIPKKLLPRAERAGVISWQASSSTCRWPFCQVGSSGGGGGGSAATGNSFGFPAWSCSGGGASGHARVAHLIDARVAHLQPEGLPANHREEEKPDQGFRVSRSGGGSGFSDTLQPTGQTLSGKSDKKR